MPPTSGSYRSALAKAKAATMFALPHGASNASGRGCYRGNDMRGAGKRNGKLLRIQRKLHVGSRTASRLGSSTLVTSTTQDRTTWSSNVVQLVVGPQAEFHNCAQSRLTLKEPNWLTGAETLLVTRTAIRERADRSISLNTVQSPRSHSPPAATDVGLARRARGRAHSSLPQLRHGHIDPGAT